VGKTAALYGAIGLFHYIFRRRFLTISMNPERPKRKAFPPALGLPVLLLVRFRGHVVGSHRRCAAGVLLLIVPSVGAMLYSDKVGTRLAIGWTMGTLVSAVGVYLSLKIDLPTGATIVCTFAIF